MFKKIKFAVFCYPKRKIGFYPDNWIDNQPLIGGGLLVWYFDENNEIKTFIFNG